MFCGRCGYPEAEVKINKILQDGGDLKEITIEVCPRCGERLGRVDYYSITTWDYLSREDCDKILKKGIDKYDEV